jgi:LPXTG-motif cell wall-anchored protein
MVSPHPLSTNQDHGKIPGAPEVSLLAATSRQGTDEKKQTGIFFLLAAVEQGVIKGVETPGGGGTRIVVAGDSEFLDDQVINSWEGNYAFGKQALNWLLQRPQIMLEGLGPQPIKEYKLYLTAAQSATVRWLFLAGLPAAILALGGLVWLRRRH